MSDMCTYCQLNTAGQHEVGCPNYPATVDYKVSKTKELKSVFETLSVQLDEANQQVATLARQRENLRQMLAEMYAVIIGSFLEGDYKQRIQQVLDNN